MSLQDLKYAYYKQVLSNLTPVSPSGRSTQDLKLAYYQSVLGG